MLYVPIAHCALKMHRPITHTMEQYTKWNVIGINAIYKSCAMHAHTVSYQTDCYIGFWVALIMRFPRIENVEIREKKNNARMIPTTKKRQQFSSRFSQHRDSDTIVTTHTRNQRRERTNKRESIGWAHFSTELDRQHRLTHPTIKHFSSICLTNFVCLFYLEKWFIDR